MITEKEIEKEIIRKFNLREDFFRRNPPAGIEVAGDYVTVYFRFWELSLDKKEYDTLKDSLIWGCAACCGFGSSNIEEDNDYIVLRGYPCQCHATHWGWSMSVQL